MGRRQPPLRLRRGLAIHAHGQDPCPALAHAVRAHQGPGRHHALPPVRRAVRPGGEPVTVKRRMPTASRYTFNSMAIGNPSRYYWYAVAGAPVPDFAPDQGYKRFPPQPRLEEPELAVQPIFEWQPFMDRGRRLVNRARGDGPSPAAVAVPPLRRSRRECEQRVQDLRELPQRRVGEARIEDPGDPAQQVAEQVAGALDGVDPELDLVRADDEPEHVEVDRPEVEREDRARVAGRQRRQRQRRNLAGTRRRGAAVATVAGMRTFSLVTRLLPDLALDRADRIDLVAALDEPLDRVRALEVLRCR